MLIYAVYFYLVCDGSILVLPIVACFTSIIFSNGGVLRRVYSSSRYIFWVNISYFI